MSHPLIEQLEERILKVGEYLELINELLAPLKVSVEGEISDLKILPQWVFFSLKDSESGEVLRCGLHSGVYRRLGVSVEEGMSVKVFGYGKISPKTGNFGFWVSKIEPIGEGALRRAYELLIKKLESEGLFSRKRELPMCVSHIGVISSKNGVVVQDLLKNLKPLGIRVDFLHSGVEGADSSQELLRAIEFFSTKKERPELLVLIRGGGSLESLQGFNNEAVARALFASPVPVLVGIGHDVDAPIATLVADQSASTPTAVAHVINESWSPLFERVPIVFQKILVRYRRRLEAIKYGSERLLQTIRYSIERLLVRFNTYTDMLNVGKERIRGRLKEIKTAQARLNRELTSSFLVRVAHVNRFVDELARIIALSDPHKVLKRGFGLVYGQNGKLIRRPEDVEVGENVITRLHKGAFESQVTKKVLRDDEKEY